MGSMKIRALIHSLALFLAGCAGIGANAQDNYPSLAKRAIESRDFVAEEVAAASTPVATVPADPAVVEQAGKLEAQANAGRAAFDRTLTDAQGKVRAASGADISSEAWVVAQAAISALESDRNDSVVALAGLDTLYVQQLNIAVGNAEAGSVVAVDGPRRTALAIVDRQNDAIDALKATLRTP